MLQRTLTLCVLPLVFACQPAPASPPEPGAPAEPAGPGGAGGGDDLTGTVSHRVQTVVETSEAGTFLVTRVTPENGFHCNMEFPWSVAVQDSAPVAAGVRQGQQDAVRFEEAGVEFRIPIPQAVGEGVAVDGRLRLSLCNEELCVTPHQDVRWAAGTP